jgi:hypothetical protein
MKKESVVVPVEEMSLHTLRSWQHPNRSLMHYSMCPCHMLITPIVKLPSCEAKISSARETISPYFAEREASLPFSHNSSIFSYPEFDKNILRSPSYFLKMHFNIIPISVPRFCKRSLSTTSPHQNPFFTSPVTRTCHVPHPAHSSQIHHVNIIWWKVKSWR